MLFFWSSAAAAGCPAEVDAARAHARTLVDAKDQAGAEAVLAAVAARCGAAVDPVRRGWLASDRALVAHRRGDDAACLAFVGAAPRLDPDSSVAIALLYNLALCGGGCNTMEADGCLGGRTARA